MKKVILLGASGSIGKSSLDVIRKFPEKLALVAASCHRSDKALKSIVNEFPDCKSCLSSRNDSAFNYSGPDSINQLLEDIEADIVINAVSGSAGLILSWKTLDSGKHLALANKESVVMAGHLLLEKAHRKSLSIIPVDSEHSALFHLLMGHPDPLEIIITASGGPFFDWDSSALKKVTPEDALKHPTWNMGPKITIDSASMANKGLEVLEAHYLFNLKPEQIKVVVHRESLVHSFIRTRDNALYAHISKPDMKLPIQNALFYPEQEPVESIYLEPWDMSMSFFKPRDKDFRMLPLAYEAIRKGQDYGILYNAANELAVEAFIQRKIKFTDIPEIVSNCNECWSDVKISSLEDILECNNIAFSLAGKIIGEYHGIT